MTTNANAGFSAAAFNHQGSKSRILLGGVSLAAILVAVPVAVVPTVDSATGASNGWTISLVKQAQAQVNLTNNNVANTTGATNPVAFIDGNITLGNGTATGGSIVANGTNVALNINGTNNTVSNITFGYNITAANAIAIDASGANASITINSTIRNNSSSATVNISGNQSATGLLSLGTSANITNTNGSGANAIQITPAANGTAYVINTAAGSIITGNIALINSSTTLNINGSTITGNITTTNNNTNGSTVNLSGSNASSGATITGSLGNNTNRLSGFNVTNGTQTVNGSVFANTSTINGTLNLTGTANVSVNLTIGASGNLTVGGNITAGNIAAASDGNGTINANATQTFTATTLGVTGTRLGLLSVGSSGVVTLNTTNTFATAVNLAANGSLTQNFAADGGAYGVNTTTLLSNSTLTITGDNGTITGAVSGSNGTGTLRINSGNTTTMGAGSSVGNNASTALALVNISNGTLNTLGNNSNITATRIVVGNGSSLQANGTGTLNATTLNVTGTANISNTTLTTGLNFINVSGAATLVNVNGTSNASLGAITSSDGNGTLNISVGTATVTATTIGNSTASIANLNVAAGTVNVSGAIFASAINISGGTTNANGAITGATTFTNNGTLNLSANHTGTISAGTDDRGNLLISGSNVTTSGAIGTAANKLANINVTGTWRPGANFSAVNVNLANGSSTFISSNVTVTGTTAFTSAGSLTITGAVVTLNVAQTANGLASTGLVTFKPTTTTNLATGLNANQTLQTNTSFRVAVDMSAVTIATGSSLVINTTNANLTGANFTTANTSFLTFTRNANNITVGTVSGGYTSAIAGATTAPGAASLGTALNTASSATTIGSDVSTILQRVQTLSGASLAAAVESLQPDNTGGGATTSAASSAGTAVAGPVTARTSAVRTANAGGDAIETGFSAGIGGRPSGAWFQGFGSMADKSSKSGFTGYDGKTWGAALGLDSQVTDRFLIGVFGAYSSTNVKPKGISTSNTDINSYSGGIYANYDITSAWYLEGLASATYHQNEARRSTAAAGGGVVTGKWNGNQYTGRVGTGYAVPMDATWTVTPNAFGQYTKLNQKDYTESGIGALTVSQKDISTTTAGIGARFTGNYRMADGWRLVPEGRLGVQQDFGSTTPSTSSFFTTTPTATFTTDGQAPGKTAGTFGAGLSYRSPAGLDLSGNYDGETRTSFISHTFLARIRQTF
jgi:mucin-19